MKQTETDREKGEQKTHAKYAEESYHRSGRGLGASQTQSSMQQEARKIPRQ